MTPEKSDPPNESFAALFEQQAKSQTPRRKAVHVGDSLEATVVQIGKDSVFVELDGKRQAYFEAADLRGPDGNVTVAVGDRVRARVVAVDGDSVRLGRSLGRPGSAAAIEQAKEAGMPLEGKVTGVNKGGLDVDLGGTRAFCPISQADSKFVQDPQALVGKSFSFLVTDVRDGGRNVVVSRRAVLERESREERERAMKDIAVGATLRGTISSVREFGAFVDLGGGVEGLIPASEIGYDRSVSVSDAVKAGDVVEVQVRDIKDAIDERRKEHVKKITLSLKALAQDPWESVDKSFEAGKVAQGTVTRVVDFGAFVRLAPGIEGLLHASELGGNERLRSFSPGQPIAVVVKSVDKKERRIGLTPAPEGTAAGARVAPVSVQVGAIVKGAVDRIETYGVFVQLEGTKGRAGRGLVPTAELGVARGTDLRKAFPEGTKVTAKVLEVGEGRLRLSLKAAKDDEERADFEGFRDRTAAPSKLGTLGDLLAKKQKK